MASTISRHVALLISDSNRMLARASLVFALLGGSAGIVLIFLQTSGAFKEFLIPTIWAFTGFVVSLAIYALARRRLVVGVVKFAAFGLFVTLPTTLFVAAHFAVPSGAATYITGPASYLYFLFIVMSGFFFDWRLSVFAGFCAAVEYVAAFLIDAQHLALLTHPDPLLIQDFTQFPIYAFKAQMMLVCGIVVGIRASHTRNLVDNIVKEEGDKLALDRLFGEYVSPEVKNHLLSLATTGAAGEKKSVALLFSDIRSYSTISEGLAPDAMVIQLNEYLDKMVSCVNENGGVVDKFIGDAVMAVFGGLLEVDNPCDRAVKAALSMQNSLNELNKQWWQKGWPAFAIGVGIHYGEVLMGSIGSARRKEFTVIGDAVNTASRIESLTKDYALPLLISREVYDRLSTDLQSKAKSLGPVQVKGKLREVEIFGVGEKPIPRQPHLRAFATGTSVSIRSQQRRHSASALSR